MDSVQKVVDKCIEFMVQFNYGKPMNYKEEL